MDGLIDQAVRGEAATCLLEHRWYRFHSTDGDVLDFTCTIVGRDDSVIHLMVESNGKPEHTSN